MNYSVNIASCYLIIFYSISFEMLFMHATITTAEIITAFTVAVTAAVTANVVVSALSSITVD